MDFVWQIVSHVQDSIKDSKFLGDGLTAFFLFTLMVGVVVKALGWLMSAKYRHWTVEVIEHALPDGKPDPENTRKSKLYWEDVRRIQNSEIEKWKTVRHLVSGYAWITTPGSKEAEAGGWLKEIPARGLFDLFGSGRLQINLPLLPKDHLDKRGWLDGRQPRGWIGQPAEKGRAPLRLFVSGHEAAHSWAKQCLLADQYEKHLADELAASLRGRDIVIGTLPANIASALCARGIRYVHLSLNLPEEMRQQPLTAEQMNQFGARLEEIFVKSQGPYKP